MISNRRLIHRSASTCRSVRRAGHDVGSPGTVVRAIRLWFCLAAIGFGGCGVFSPAFVSLLDPTGSGGFITLDNAPGHVVVTFANNAQVDERLLAFLEGNGLVLTDEEKRSLRPRMRLRVRVTFTDGTFQIIEFIDGSSKLVDPTFDTEAVPDLNQNDLNNAVVLCDVASVILEPGTAIEVFMPVQLTEFQLVQTTTQGGGIVTTFEQRGQTPPQFRALQVDDVDADGNVTLLRNIGVRDVPSPAINLLCGSVVAIVVDGVLSVPFFTGVSDAPSFDPVDAGTVARIGGRYEFRVEVR